jgi:hypothetical protein
LPEVEIGAKLAAAAAGGGEIGRIEKSTTIERNNGPMWTWIVSS